MVIEHGTEKVKVLARASMVEQGPSSQESLKIQVEHRGHSVEMTLIKSGENVSAHYADDGVCQVVSGVTDLASLQVGDVIVLGVAIPKDNE